MVASDVLTSSFGLDLEEVVALWSTVHFDMVDTINSLRRIAQAVFEHQRHQDIEVAKRLVHAAAAVAPVAPTAGFTANALVDLLSSCSSTDSHNFGSLRERLSRACDSSILDMPLPTPLPSNDESVGTAVYLLCAAAGSSAALAGAAAVCPEPSKGWIRKPLERRSGARRPGLDGFAASAPLLADLHGLGAEGRVQLFSAGDDHSKSLAGLWARFLDAGRSSSMQGNRHFSESDDDSDRDEELLDHLFHSWMAPDLERSQQSWVDSRYRRALHTPKPPRSVDRTSPLWRFANASASDRYTVICRLQPSRKDRVRVFVGPQWLQPRSKDDRAWGYQPDWNELLLFDDAVEVDLHRWRPETALKVLDFVIGEARGFGVPYLLVVHGVGHGTIRRHLNKSVLKDYRIDVPPGVHDPLLRTDNPGASVLALRLNDKPHEPEALPPFPPDDYS